MAESLASLRKKGGGGMQETVLWTNPNPTTAMSATNITLSDDPTNYDFIGVQIRKANTSAGALYAMFYMSSDDFVNVANETNGFGMAFFNGGYARKFRWNPSSNVVAVSSTWRAGDSGTSNGTTIPQKVSGFRLK